MTGNIPRRIALLLIRMVDGESVPNSIAKHRVVDDLVAEGIISRTGRIQKKLTIIHPEQLKIYLKNKYGISDLNQYVSLFEADSVSRGELADVSGDSKLRKVRTFKGFLVNTYETVNAILNGKPILIVPVEGTFQFIYDFESFSVDPDLTIVGVENPENFRWIRKQRYLFYGKKILFVSRYPQNQSKDLISWLQSISNPYIHFGDFDLAGISIYLHEFRKHLGFRASFFVPENMEDLFRDYGNKDRYDVQRQNFSAEDIEEPDLKILLKLIHQYKKGVDQEVLIH